MVWLWEHLHTIRGQTAEILITARYVSKENAKIAVTLIARELR